MPLLSLKGVSAAYGQRKVLHGVDLDVEAGGFVAVLGANGAGKTSLLRAICGQLTITGGTILLGGVNIVGQSTNAIVRRGVGHVPEGRGTLADLTVHENFRLAAYLAVPRPRRSSAIERAYGYFPLLRQRRAQMAGTLSGGEQQMLAVARALVGTPQLLLLDEPSLGLAPQMIQQLFTALQQIHREERVSMILVEQNATLALQTASHALLLRDGAVLLAGDATTLQAHPAVQTAYLGGEAVPS